MLHKKIGFLWGALAVGVFLSGCGSKSPLDPKNPVAIDVCRILMPQWAGRKALW